MPILQLPMPLCATWHLLTSPPCLGVYTTPTLLDVFTFFKPLLLDFHTVWFFWQFWVLFALRFRYNSFLWLQEARRWSVSTCASTDLELLKWLIITFQTCCLYRYIYLINIKYNSNLCIGNRDLYKVRPQSDVCFFFLGQPLCKLCIQWPVATLATVFDLLVGLSQFPLTITDQMPGFSKKKCNGLSISAYLDFLSPQGFWEDFVL